MLYAATASHWPGSTQWPPRSRRRVARRMMVGAGGNSRRLSFRHASRYGRLHVHEEGFFPTYGFQVLQACVLVWQAACTYRGSSATRRGVQIGMPKNVAQGRPCGPPPGGAGTATCMRWSASPLYYACHHAAMGAHVKVRRLDENNPRDSETL